MKVIIAALALLSLLHVADANACGFRLSSGKLLKCGMLRIDLLALAGQPESKDTEVLGVDNGSGTAGETIELWSYKLAGDIGGEYLVAVTLTAGKVTAIRSKQVDRI